MIEGQQIKNFVELAERNMQTQDVELGIRVSESINREKVFPKSTIIQRFTVAIMQRFGIPNAQDYLPGGG